MVGKTELIKGFEGTKCIRPSVGQEIESEIQVFCDASLEALATVATISVAKLELQAALLGSRKAKTLREEMTILIKRRRLWTGSSCVRNWLRMTALYYLI